MAILRALLELFLHLINESVSGQNEQRGCNAPFAHSPQHCARPSKVEAGRRSIKLRRALRTEQEFSRQRNQSRVVLEAPSEHAFVQSMPGDYNVQTAVDAKHYLIVAHELTNVGNDRSQLANMAKQASAEMAIKELTVVADRGYFKGEEILACEKAGITAFVPKPLTFGSKAEGRFDKQDFIYEAKVWISAVMAPPEFRHKGATLAHVIRGSNFH